MTAAVLNQNAFEGYADDNVEGSATSKNGVDGDWTQAVDVNFRIRFVVQETAGGMAVNTQPQLEYNLGGLGWNAVNATSNVVRSSSTIHWTDGGDTTQQIGSGTFVSPNEGFDDTNGLAGEGNSMDLSSNESEAEFCVQIRSADVNNNDTLQLRVTDAGTAFGNYTSTPTITVSESVNVTLAANTGSYSLTGSAANTEYHRVIAAATGSYAITGLAATTAKSYMLAANTGAYTITGVAANTEYHRVLAAVTGSYAITGLAANTEFHRVIAAATGSYVVTGVAATTAKSFLTAANTGSYAISGLAASLLHDSVIAAATGSYTITGLAATTAKTFLIAANTGSYSIVGVDANLEYHQVLAAVQGAYAVNGLAANLEYHRLLAAVTGSYSITGLAATTSVASAGETIAAVPGSYTISGLAATLTATGAAAGNWIWFARRLSRR